jgi:hypothetical protein
MVRLDKIPYFSIRLTAKTGGSSIKKGRDQDYLDAAILSYLGAK